MTARCLKAWRAGSRRSRVAITLSALSVAALPALPAHPGLSLGAMLPGLPDLPMLGVREVHAQEPEATVPFIPTPLEVVHDMLDLASVTGIDRVYDLGSGDGRIPIAAATRYGARGVGVEIDSALVALSRRRASEAGVSDRVRFVHGDLFEMDLRPATVVTLYLFSELNMLLRPKLLRELRPGARVVSNVFDMGDWEPDQVEQRLEFGAFLYFWVIPARVEGVWQLAPLAGAPSSDDSSDDSDDHSFVLEIDQRFQRICGRIVSPDGRVVPVIGEVNGEVLRLRRVAEMRAVAGAAVASAAVASAAEPPLPFTARISGERATRIGADTRWSAVRVEAGAMPDLSSFEGGRSSICTGSEDPDVR